MAGNQITTNYLVAVTVDNLKEVQKLATAMQAVQDIAKSQKTHTIKLKFDVDDAKGVSSVLRDLAKRAGGDISEEISQSSRSKRTKGGGTTTYGEGSAADLKSLVRNVAALVAVLERTPQGPTTQPGTASGTTAKIDFTSFEHQMNGFAAIIQSKLIDPLSKIDWRGSGTGGGGGGGTGSGGSGGVRSKRERLEAWSGKGGPPLTETVRRARELVQQMQQLEQVLGPEATGRAKLLTGIRGYKGESAFARGGSQDTLIGLLKQQISKDPGEFSTLRNSLKEYKEATAAVAEAERKFQAIPIRDKGRRAAARGAVTRAESVKLGAGARLLQGAGDRIESIASGDLGQYLQTSGKLQRLVEGSPNLGFVKSALTGGDLDAVQRKLAKEEERRLLGATGLVGTKTGKGSQALGPIIAQLEAELAAGTVPAVPDITSSVKRTRQIDFTSKERTALTAQLEELQSGQRAAKLQQEIAELTARQQQQSPADLSAAERRAREKELSNRINAAKNELTNIPKSTDVLQKQLAKGYRVEESRDQVTTPGTPARPLTANERATKERQLGRLKAEEEHTYADLTPEQGLTKLLTSFHSAINQPPSERRSGYLDYVQPKVAPLFTDPNHALAPMAARIAQELKLDVASLGGASLGGAGTGTGGAGAGFAEITKNLKGLEEINLSKLETQFKDLTAWAQQLADPLIKIQKILDAFSPGKASGRAQKLILQQYHDIESRQLRQDELRQRESAQGTAFDDSGERKAANRLRDEKGHFTRIPGTVEQERLDREARAKQSRAERAAADVILAQQKEDASNERLYARRGRAYIDNRHAEALKDQKDRDRDAQRTQLAQSVVGGITPNLYNTNERFTAELTTRLHGIDTSTRSYVDRLAKIAIREPLGFDVTKQKTKAGEAGLDLESQYTTLFGQLEKALVAGGPQGPLAPLSKPYAAFQDIVQKRQAAGALPTGVQGPQTAAAAKLLKIEQDISAELLRQVRERLEQIKAQETQRSLGVDLFLAAKRVAIYGGLGLIGYNIINSFRQAAQEVITLESSLARIQGILRSKSLSERLEIQSSVIKSAQDYGTSLDDIVRATTIFAQTGLNAREAISAARESIAGQLGAGIEPGQAQELLIAVRNISEGHILNREILDRLSRIESTRPVTAQDLAISLQRVGSLASTLQPERIGGVDFADLIIGATSTIVGHTRVSGNQAATALKFILSRLSAPETANKLQTTFGVKLAADEKGTLRPLQDVLSDIASTYKATKGTNRGQELLQTVAGARQVNIAAALFGNFDEAMKTAQESSEALGDTQKRLNIQMDTVTQQMARLHAAFVGFMNALLDKTGVLWGLRAVVLPAATAAVKGATRAPGLTLAATGLAGYQLANFGLSKLKDAAYGLSGGSKLAAGLERVGAGEALVGAAGLFKLISILGLILTAVEIGISLWRSFRDNQERYGFHPTDLKLLFSNEVFQNYRAQAGSFGLTDTELRQRVSRASVQTQEEINRRHPELGPNIFSNFEELRPKAPGLHTEIQNTFLRNLTEAIPGFTAIGEGLDNTARAAEQMRVALDLLNSSLKISSFILNDQTAKLEEQVNRELGDLLERLGAGITVQTGFGPIGGHTGTRLPDKTSAEIAINAITKGIGAGILDLKLGESSQPSQPPEPSGLPDSTRAGRQEGLLFGPRFQERAFSGPGWLLKLLPGLRGFTRPTVPATTSPTQPDTTSQPDITSPTQRDSAHVLSRRDIADLRLALTVPTHRPTAPDTSLTRDIADLRLALTVPTHELLSRSLVNPTDTVRPTQRDSARVLARRDFGPDTTRVRDPNRLEPDVRDALTGLLIDARLAGHNVQVRETARTPARQDWLFQQGRVRPGPKVTWTLDSDHQKNRAVDLMFNGDISGRDPGYRWLQENAPKYGFGVLGRNDPGHIALPRPADLLAAADTASNARPDSFAAADSTKAPRPTDSFAAAGVIDSTKATRAALQNTTSIDLFTAALDAVNGDMQKFGRGLDLVTLKFLRLSPVQQQQVSALEEQIKVENRRNGFVASETKLRKQVIDALDTTPGGEGAAAILRNRQALDEKVYQNFIRTYKQTKRLQAGGVGGEEGPGGLTFGDEILSSVQRALRRAEEELKDKLTTAEIASFHQLSDALGDEKYRTAVLGQFGKRGATALITDRLTQALGGYAQEAATIENTSQNFGAAGLGFDAVRERAQLSAGLLRTVSGIGPLLRNELLQVRTRLNLSDKFELPIDVLSNLDGVSGTSPEAGAARSAVNEQLLSSFYGALPKAEHERLTAQLGQLQQVAGLLAGDEDLLTHLDTDDRALLQTAIRARPEEFIGKLPELFVILQRLAKLYNDEEVAREREIDLIKRGSAVRDRERQHQLALSQIGVGAARRINEARFGPGGGLRYGLVSARLDREAAFARVADERQSRLDEAQRNRKKLGESVFQDEVRKVNADYQDARQGAKNDYERRAKELEIGLVTDAIVSALQNMQQAVRDATAGFRDMITDFDKLHKATAGDVLDTLVQGFGDTLFKQVGNLALDALTGPQGIFGDQLQSLFKTGAVLEAELIYQAHLEGITAGFAAIRDGGITVGDNGLGASADTQIASADTPIPSLGLQINPVTRQGESFDRLPTVGNPNAIIPQLLSGFERSSDDFQTSITQTSTTLGTAADDINKLASQFGGAKARKAALKKLAGLGPYGETVGGYGLRGSGPAYADTQIPSVGLQFNPVTNQFATTETSTTLGAAADDINSLASQFDVENSKAARKAALKKIGGQIIGQYGGAFVGQAISPHKNSYAGEGAALGTAIGSLIPGGTIIGGALGGILGGLFGKKTPKKPPELTSLERIERNTRETITAIDNQTNQLLNLDNRLLNVPASFVVPGYRPLAVGAGADAAGAGAVVQQTIAITITDSRDPNATASAVAQVLRQESRQYGSYTSPRR